MVAAALREALLAAAAMDKDAAQASAAQYWHTGCRSVRFRVITEADAPSFAELVAELGRRRISQRTGKCRSLCRISSEVSAASLAGRPPARTRSRPRTPLRPVRPRTDPIWAAAPNHTKAGNIAAGATRARRRASSWAAGLTIQSKTRFKGPYVSS